jgi:hypothetical protein
MPDETDASKAASLMGKRSYKSRLERLGLARLQEIARANGRKGGRPAGSGAQRTKETKETNKTKKGSTND